MSTIRQLDPDRWAPAETRRTVYRADLPVGTQIDDLSVPAFLARIGARFPNIRAGDRVEFWEEMGAFVVDAVITHVSNLGISVVLLKGAQLGDVSAAGAAAPIQVGLNVKYLGTHLMWCAMRGEEVLKPGFKTQGEANQWITSYSKTTDAKP
jgi:hypothetical protein